MPRRGRPTASIELSQAERETLERWVRRHSSAQSLALRSRVVLGCAEGRTNAEIAEFENVNPATVSKWRNRFARDRLEGLRDASRPGAERKISDATIEAVIIDTLESAPGEDTHWSTRGLADKHGIGKTTVAEIWRAFGLKPWKQDSFKVSPDPDLVEKVRDLVGLYMNPPDAAAVFAVDEKPQIQALNRTAPTFPMLPTTPQRATHDYERNGTVDLFAALDVASGTVITDIYKTHNQDDFVAFLNKINREVPALLDVHIILDNLSAHKAPAVRRWLLRHHRFHLHFTPTYGSWMNLVERWFSALTTKKLQRSTHRNTKDLSADILAWAAAWNKDPKPFVWHKTAEQILERLAGYCAAINQDAGSKEPSADGASRKPITRRINRTAH
jgi:transposase